KESINFINVFKNSSEYFLEDLFSNQPSGNPTFSSHPELTSPKVKNDIFDSEGGNVLHKKLLDLDSTKDLHPPLHVNPLSGSTTYYSNPLLEEFADEHALITFPPKYDDDLQFDVESDLKEIEFLLHQDIDSSLKNSIDQSNLANPADNFGEKIKESKLLIDELDLPCDFLPTSEYDSFISQDFFRVDALPSTNNEDKEAFSEEPQSNVHLKGSEPDRVTDSPYRVKSAKQSIFATSFAEAEYIDAFNSSNEAVWARKFISGLGVVPIIEEPISIYCDNTGAIAISNESGIIKGARHFHAKVHYLREVIEYGDIKLEKVHTDDNLADLFTKA
nr:retrovirus-related Pol polyprotein from transposon TNT 1-94 [Tanacetum cinerariifolium]